MRQPSAHRVHRIGASLMRSRILPAFVACLGLLLFVMPPNVTAQRAAQASEADRVIATYYRMLNAGLQSGDFSAVPAVYAPNARLRHVTLQGDNALFQGLNAIRSYYQAAYKSIPGAVFKTESVRDLSPTIVMTYDRAFTKGQEIGRCVHVFVLQHDKIVTHDWINYSAGKR